MRLNIWEDNIYNQPVYEYMIFQCLNGIMGSRIAFGDWRSRLQIHVCIYIIFRNKYIYLNKHIHIYISINLQISKHKKTKRTYIYIYTHIFCVFIYIHILLQLSCIWIKTQIYIFFGICYQTGQNPLPTYEDTYLRVFQWTKWRYFRLFSRPRIPIYGVKSAVLYP